MPMRMAAPLTVSSVTTPANGTAVINADGTITYAPAANFNGADSFTYTIGDSRAESNGHGHVTVTSVNDGPTAADDSAATAEDTAATRAVLANDADADGGRADGEPVTSPPTARPSSTRTGDYVCAGRELQRRRQLHLHDWRQPGGSRTRHGQRHGHERQRRADRGRRRGATAEDTAATRHVLANDADADGGTALTATRRHDPANGTAAINATARFTYAPDANFNGADSFTYTIG